MTPSPYVLKTGQYSSHALLQRRLPALGLICLDVGDGEGHLASSLAQRGHAVTVLAAPGTVSTTTDPRVTIVECDLDWERPAIDGAFDRIVLGDVLEHLRDPEGCLRWLRTLLAPEGTVLVSVPNAVHVYARVRVLLGDFPHDTRGLFDRTHRQFYSGRGWVHLFAAAGLQVIWRDVTPIPFELVLPSTPGLAAGLERVYHRVAGVLPGFLAYQYVFELEPR